MLKLLRRNMIIIKYRLIAYFSLCTVCMILFMLKLKVYGMVPVIVVTSLFCYFYLLSFFEVEGKNYGDAMLVATPYKRTELLYSKFLSALIVTGIYYIVSTIISCIINIMNTRRVTFSGIGFGVLICSLLIAVIMPVYIKYDYIKAANFCMMLVFAFAIILVLLIKYNTNWEWISLPMENYGMGEDVILCLVGVICLIVSVFVSRRVYLSKEF